MVRAAGGRIAKNGGSLPEALVGGVRLGTENGERCPSRPPLLSCEQPPPTGRGKQLTGAVTASSYIGGQSRKATHAPDVTDWPAARVSRAELRRYAESIGQRPAFLFPAESRREAERPAGPVVADQGAPDSEKLEPQPAWARGIRRVAWDAANAIIGRGEKLTTIALENEMLVTGKVERKGREFSLKTEIGSLLEREMTAVHKTITGWVTELKKLLQQ